MIFSQKKHQEATPIASWCVWYAKAHHLDANILYHEFQKNQHIFWKNSKNVRTFLLYTNHWGRLTRRPLLVLLSLPLSPISLFRSSRRVWFHIALSFRRRRWISFACRSAVLGRSCLPTGCRWSDTDIRCRICVSSSALARDAAESCIRGVLPDRSLSHIHARSTRKQCRKKTRKEAETLGGIKC